MNKLAFALVGAGALAMGSAASATITIGTTGTTSGTVSLTNVDSPVNKLTFDTTGAAAGTTTSFFDFQESFASIAKFALTTTDGTITLEELLTGGGASLIQSVSGSSGALFLTTNPLLANTTYRFRYTGNLPAGGNMSGTASFSPAVPEPGTWALMLVGFGGMGVAMRRNRKRVVGQLA